MRMNAAIEASRSSGCAGRPLRRRGIPARWRRGSSDLPFTVKDDLREHYPLGLLAVAARELRRIHASSGSRGSPTVVAYTQHDLDVWSEVMAYCMDDGRRAARAWSSTTPTATGCSPAGSASTRARSGSAR